MWENQILQYHPFTISSLAESGEMKLLIRVERGFTRKLMRHLEQVDHDEVTIKAMFHGPYGARYQPLITFDTCLFSLLVRVVHSHSQFVLIC